MKFSKNNHTSSVCPQTGKSIKTTSYHRFLKRLFPITGFLALVWFLIRVIPKPSRANYPCQRAVFPIASAFVAWAVGIVVSVLAFRKAERLRSKKRLVWAMVFIVVGVTSIGTVLISTHQKPALAHEPIVANEPIGQAKGIFPGRVVWIHDPAATSWPGSDGDTSTPYWHEDQCTDQAAVNQMVSKALLALTGADTDAEAWEAIFKNFNQQMGTEAVGYTKGQKIAIKTNFVLMNTNPRNGDKPRNVLDQIDTSPQIAIAMLKQLTDKAGVAPADICIGDPQMMMPNHWYKMVSEKCPGVVYLTKQDTVQEGRIAVGPDDDAPFYWSDPIPSRTEGKLQDHIPTHYAQADYLINLPVLKSHNDNGVSLGGKNHYGSLMRTPSFNTPYYDMHNTRATETPGMGHYRAIVDLLGHPKLGGKTLITLIDGLYASRSWDSHPIRWKKPPFNDDWPSSIFLSQDPVAIDSVAFDFLDYEWDAAPDDINGYPQKSGSEDYLHEAALVPNPPSGVKYDPAHDGGLKQSLGVHEHWNNPTDKKYSRNLDPENGKGIELVSETIVKVANAD